MSGSKILNDWERPEYGVLVTMRPREGTGYISKEFTGLVRDSLRAAGFYCDAHSMLITCISTPNTIHSDITGIRRNSSNKNHSPERILLSQVGRLDLMAPEIR